MRLPSATSPACPLAAPRHASAGPPADRMTLAEVQVAFGRCDPGPLLSEDGRSSPLAPLPGGGLLLLSACGSLVTVEEGEAPQLYRTSVFRGQPASMWESLAARHPGLSPGAPALPRYRVLEERLSPYLARYACFDLLTFQIAETHTCPKVARERARALGAARSSGARGECARERGGR